MDEPAGDRRRHHNGPPGLVAQSHTVGLPQRRAGQGRSVAGLVAAGVEGVQRLRTGDVDVPMVHSGHRQPGSLGDARIKSRERLTECGSTRVTILTLGVEGVDPSIAGRDEHPTLGHCRGGEPCRVVPSTAAGRRSVCLSIPRPRERRRPRAHRLRRGSPSPCRGGRRRRSASPWSRRCTTHSGWQTTGVPAQTLSPRRRRPTWDHPDGRRRRCRRQPSAS